MTDSTIPFFSFQKPFAEEAHCTVSPTLKFSILLCLFRPFIADCQSTSLPAIERTAGTVKVRCTVVSLFLNALDMLAIRAILCRRMFLPVYAIFCDSWHIIPRDSYARPTVWGMKSPAGGGRGGVVRRVVHHREKADRRYWLPVGSDSSPFPLLRLQGRQ